MVVWQLNSIAANVKPHFISDSEELTFKIFTPFLDRPKCGGDGWHVGMCGNGALGPRDRDRCILNISLKLREAAHSVITTIPFGSSSRLNPHFTCQ
jgi:hypothetical protein